MSNDRLYIKCRGCGKHLLLIKYYPSGSWLWEEKEIAPWMLEHIECSDYYGAFNLNGDRCFDIFAESDNKYTEYILASES